MLLLLTAATAAVAGVTIEDPKCGEGRKTREKKRNQ